MNQPRQCVNLAGLVVVVVAVAIAPVRSQVTESAKPGPAVRDDQEAAWQRLRSMVGVWKGDGEPGSARVEQSYELIVQSLFLQAHTLSTSKSDTHEDREIFSFDRLRGKVVLRQFVSEGFVNRYVLDRIDNGGRTLVFISEACENAPPGFRVRQTMIFEDDNRIQQELELGPAGKPFSRCSANNLARGQ